MSDARNGAVSLNSPSAHSSSSEFTSEFTIHRALELRSKSKLDFDPFPKDILSIINPTYSFKPFENDGELVVPLTAIYQCEFDGTPTYMEEKGKVLAGSEYGKTRWLSSRRLGNFPTPVDQSLVKHLQETGGTSEDVKILEDMTAHTFTEQEARTQGRFVAALLAAGDNHITLLTAAYCFLFDRLWCDALKASRRPTPSIPSEHRILGSFDWKVIFHDINTPVVVVGNNPRYVNFWRSVCGDGMNYSGTVEVGDKTFCSPWASLGFRGLLNALVVSGTCESHENDLSFLEMQEALEDYVVEHGLYVQAEAAGRLASRLPWLVKYNFLSSMPLSVHTADVLWGKSRSVVGQLPSEDITFQLPPRFTIATLLIAGHLLETKFNHWVTKTIDVDIAKVSDGAAYRKLFYEWETRCRAQLSGWDSPDMKEINEIAEFLGHILYSRQGDLKLRGAGINTSYWEAALIGPSPQTSAEAVLQSQAPQTTFIGGTILSVNSTWFAKLRASNLFGNRIFETPFNDFPFPTEQIHAGYLTDIEQRLALLQKELPSFTLISLQFGRNKPPYPFPKPLIELIPKFPPGIGAHRTGTFSNQFLYPTSKDSHDKARQLRLETSPVQSDQLAGEEIQSGEALRQDLTPYLRENWQPVVPPTHGKVHHVQSDEEGNNSGFLAFSPALSKVGKYLSLDVIKEAARSQGWSEGELNAEHLGKLSKHFGVETIVEDEIMGSFQFKSIAGAPSIHLIRFEEGNFGWVEKQTEIDVAAQKKKKGVRFE